MSKYKSNKPTTPGRKKRSGSYKGTEIKSSDFLPSVFQTNVNKSWLNATFDQMISKSDLKDIDELVGTKDGKYFDKNDIYMSTSEHDVRGIKQFEPAIVSRDKAKDLTNLIGIDDISNSINVDFDQYNYNAAYQTRASTFLPPIDVDKFINYGQYYWIENLPVYESFNSTITYTNVVSEINGEIEYTFKDDVNEFPLMDGMIIEFTIGYGQWDGWQFLVTGVGDFIKLRPYRSNTGKNEWNALTSYNAAIRGYWDKGDVKQYERGTVSVELWDYIKDHNANKTLPLLKLRDTGLVKKVNSDGTPVNGVDTYISGRVIARFAEDWNFQNSTGSYPFAKNFQPSELDGYKVFIIDTDTDGDIEATCIIDARLTGNNEIEQFIASNINNEFAMIAENLENYDIIGWDNDFKLNSEKDYIVIDRADPIASAWSRVNMWIHKEALFTIASMTNTSDQYLLNRKDFQAKRPIIEFNKNMWLTNHGYSEYKYDFVWQGNIDFIMLSKTVAETELSVGTTFVVIGDDKVYEVTATGSQVNATLTAGDTMFIMSGGIQSLVDKYQYQDVWFTKDGEFMVAQKKKRINFAPYFKLYDEDQTLLSDTTKYPNNTDRGSKIFGYKPGTGTKDPELNFALAYQDTGFKAEIVFENFLDNTEVTYSKTLSSGSQLATQSTIPGYYYYKQGIHYKSNYQTSYKPIGSLTDYQVIVDDASVALEIPVGSDSWETNKEFLFYEADDCFAVRELYMKGIYHDYGYLKPQLIMQRNKKYEFHDLVGDLEIYDKDYNVETNYTTISLTAPYTYDIEFDSNASDYYYYGCPHLGTGRIVVVDDINQVYHKLYINGKFVPSSKYTITNNQIIVPSTLLETDSVVDVQYYTSELRYTLDTEIPEVHKHNATNETIDTFTFSETMDHWKSIIESSVEFDGQGDGNNNSHRKFSVQTNGGTIFRHDDISVMQDITLSDDSLNVSAGLVEQGREWDNFKQRFIAQVKKLYKQQSWSSVKDIVNQAVDNITVTRKGTLLHADSNMIYTGEENFDRIELTGSNQTFTTKFTFNSDRTKQDHYYIYLTDDKKNTGYMTTRILHRDSDYTVDGSEITLLVNAIEIPSQLPYVTVYYHEMDKVSHVPASMTKLGLEVPRFIHINNGKFVGHDGAMTQVGNQNFDLYDMNSQTFDPVVACLWDLETRIYNNLAETEHYISANAYLPSQHRDTWYTLNDVNNSMEKYFRKWMNKNNIWNIDKEDEYDPANSNTWNYNSMDLHGHMEHLTGNKLPGSWQGNYIILFGTERPDCMPWIMLGFAWKPKWWDDHYSWTDPTKRTSLLEALRTGQQKMIWHNLGVSEQSIAHARYYWDWDNHCPVKTDGTLEDPEVVLGTPDPIDAAVPFEWGDYGYIERRWRHSGEGVGALVGTVVKMNRTKAWTDFFQPGFIVDKNSLINSKRISPNALHYHGGLYGETVKSINIIDSSTGLGTNSTVDIISPASSLGASAIANVNASGELTHVSLTTRGNNFDQDAAKHIENVGGQTFSYANVDMVKQVIPFHANGINVTQLNKIKRNNESIDLEQLYKSIDTQLLVKMGGFTDKSLLNIQTESGIGGAFKINDNDYEIVLLQGKPTRVDVVSQIYIEKLSQGFRIKGISNAQQRFTFNEPLTQGANAYKNLSLDNSGVVRQYSKHSSKESYIEYGATLSKVQDTYNFIRGYDHYLKSRGVLATNDIGSSAFGFANWTTHAQIGEVYIIDIGSGIGYKSDHGHILEFGAAPEHQNELLDPQGKKIESGDLRVIRTENQLRAITADGSLIGSAGFSEVDYEHGLLLSNKTQFNSTIFNDISNVRHQRLHLKGKRTDGWKGHKSAKGYIVKSNGINPNFDSSVNQIDYYYKTDIKIDNDDISKMEKLTNGNIDRDWSKGFNLSDNVLSNFYREMIKDRGTTGIASKLNRSTLINLGNSNLTTKEEWMFRNGYMGDPTRRKTTEIELKRSNNASDIRLVDFFNDAPVYVNNEIQVDFPKVTMEKQYPMFAGDCLETEVDYVVPKLPDLDTLYDSLSDYANIPTWNGTTSYKRGDRVRRNGMLLKCNTNFIGYTSEVSNNDQTGSVSNPTFSFRQSGTPNAVIDGVSVYFNKTTTLYSEIIVTGSNQPIQSPKTLNIDNTSVSLVVTSQQQIIDTTQPFSGNPHVNSNALGTGTVIVDNYGKTLEIEGTTINLWDPADETPTITTTPNPDQSETITGDTTTTVWPLTIPTDVDTVTVTVPAGYTEVIDLVNAEVTITPALPSPPDADSEVTVTYTIQDTVTSGPPITGVNIDADDVVAFITAANIANVSAQKDSNGVISIIKDVNGNTTGALFVGNGTANSDLGIAAGSFPPAVDNITVDEPISTAVARNLINASNIPNVTASLDVNQNLVLTKIIGGSVDPSQDTLDITGNANLSYGFPVQTGYPSSIRQDSSTVSDARDFINSAAITGITASVVQNGRLVIQSANGTLVIGDNTELQTEAGINAGTYYSLATPVENDYNDQKTFWDVDSFNDPALFNIFVLDDTDYEKVQTDSIDSKFWDWNVLSVQDFGLYTFDEGKTECSICAGVESPEGNDARVTVQKTHNLEVGDYVMLVNTTTQPSCDGIHKVTRVGDITEPKSFYIDMYIEECGSSPAVFVLRNSRFFRTNDRTASTSSDYYNPKLQELAWTSRDGQSRVSTSVHRWAGGQGYKPVSGRYSNKRITHDKEPGFNKVIGASIYDGRKQSSLIDLEIYDPARGLWPGVAMRELDNIGEFDLAQYTNSTDLLFEGNERNAWGEERVGTTWFNTSSINYWDYDQGGYDYRKEHWGKLITGSVVEVYEWTKSSVPPDEYKNLVLEGKEIFGTVATGEVFKEFDASVGEDIYYYTQDQIWNDSTSDYDVVYYFWVKEKLYVPNTDRIYSTQQLATILRDPTQAGIAWMALVDSKQIIIANAQYYLNSDTILQLTYESEMNHNNWFILNEGTDTIPEYWFVGLRDNVTGLQGGYDRELPTETLHPYNRFGDDRKIGQTWYKDKYETRRQALSVANRMLKEMNLFEDLPYKWDRTLTDKSRIIDFGVNADLVPAWIASTSYTTGDRVISNRIVYEALSSFTSGVDEFIDINTSDWVMISQLYDMTRVWEYADYVHPAHPSYKRATVLVDNRVQALAVDPTQHQTVGINIYNASKQLDESEIFNWINDEWILTHKRNSTIEFNDFISNKDNDMGWDFGSWDQGGWDQNTAIYAYHVIEALRNDIFIQMHKDNFNKFFFAMVKYAISTQKQVDWVYKTTYIQAEIENKLDEQPKVYKKNTVNEVVGYLESVKPFHTKVRTVFDKYTVDENLDVAINDSNIFNITIDSQQLDPKETFQIEYLGDEISLDFGSNTEDTFAAPAFTDTASTDTLVSGGFNNSYDWSLTGVDVGNVGRRRAIYYFDTQEHLSVRVLTNTSGNTVDADSRTYQYLQDNNGYISVYALEDAMTATVDVDTTSDDTSIILSVGEGLKFIPTGGFALINNEVLQYGRVDGDTLLDVTRGEYAAKIVSGDTIIDVTNNKLDTIESIIRDSSLRLNEIGKSILDNTSSSLDAKSLQANGQGTAF